MHKNISNGAIPAIVTLVVLLATPTVSSAGSLVFKKKGHVDCGDIFNVAEGTIEFRMKPATNNNNEWLLSKARDKKNLMVIGFGPDIFMFTVRRDGVNRYAFTEASRVSPGAWRHVALTFRGEEVEIFVDGAPGHRISDPGGSYGLDHLKGGRLIIGKGVTGKEYYNGHLAEVRLSDVIRYTRRFTPQRTPFVPDANTVALWHFDGKGKRVRNARDKGAAGRVVGAVGRSKDTPLVDKLAEPLATKVQPRPPLPPTGNVKLQPAPKIATGKGATRASVRADGCLVVNGTPVFPVGMRTEQADSLKPIADAGFNLVLGSGEWGADHYAAAAQNKLLVLGGHYVWATFASFRTPGKGIDLRPTEEAGVRTVLEQGRDQSQRRPLETLAAFDHLPGVIGWNISEEPEGKLTEAIEYGYEIFKSHNPAHLVAVLSCDPRWFHAFRNAADLLIVDNYPFRGTARKKRSLLETYDWIQRARDGMKGKPVWLMSQLIPPSEWSSNPQDEISLRDMRLQHYAGLIAGAKGVIMYHWPSLRIAHDGNKKVKVSDDVFQGRFAIVKAMVAELNAIGPVISGGRPTRELEIFWLEPGAQGPGPQLTRELDLYGRKYLLVVNLLDVPVTGKVFGINGGNRRAYDARVFLGEGDLTVAAEAPGEPRLTIGPRGAGAFVLDRRPIEAAARKK